MRHGCRADRSVRGIPTGRVPTVCIPLLPPSPVSPPPVLELTACPCGVRRMQVGGGSIVSVLGHCYKTEGLAGLFKGFSMNCIKGPISTGISFTLFDLLKEAML